MTIPPYQPGRPTWQAGYEHCKRQAFGISVTAGDPAHRIAQMRPTPPVRDVELDEMRERFARQGGAPPPYKPSVVDYLGAVQSPVQVAPRPLVVGKTVRTPTTLHERVAAQDSASGGNALCGQIRGNEGVGG